MTLTFRDAAGSDVLSCAALPADGPIGAAREGEPSDPACPEAFRRMQAHGGDRPIVAQAEHEAIVGRLQLVILPGLSIRGSTRAEIEGVRVARSHRSRAKLVAHALAEARREGASLVQLTSSLAHPDARRFWIAQGFPRTHAGFKPPL